jgi:hypothetical protein
MRQFSLRRQKQETQLIAVVAKIRKERGGKCEDCGYAGITDPSHNYSRKDFASLIAVHENITLLCRNHHNAFADNRLWLLKNGERILRHMKWQYENEPDQFRALSMRQHLNGKLQAAKENAELWSEKFPAWAEKLLSETEF